VRRLPIVAALVCALLWTPPAGAQEGEEEEEADPAEVAIGERLFLETRFAQFFFANAGGKPNAVLAQGDPAVARTFTTAGSVSGAFIGRSMNCRVCHLVDDVKDVPGAGSRSYGDFARRSPIPTRGDGETTTPRNSPPLVNSTLARSGPFFLHFDGEFPTAEALVEGTFTGRNFGWLADERDEAVRHIAAVIRGDDGSGQLAKDFGGPYRVVLAGRDRSIPKDFRLPPRFRVDVDTASDEEIVDGVAKLVAAYVKSLELENASPYDRFLEKNFLPGEPDDGETLAEYLARLRLLLGALTDPQFVVDGEDGSLALHEHPFVFGPTELSGLRRFLDHKRANCVACHLPPAFTDFQFHDTGATQEEYDAIHGAGSFVALPIPDLATRDADPARWLPATAAFPLATGSFRAAPSADQPGRTDLGLWNIYANPALAGPRQQRALDRMVCKSLGGRRACRRRAPTPDARLAAAVGLFKTPGLRDLGHSAPYLHTGGFDTIEDVVRFYMRTTALARAGLLRNGAPELTRMEIGEADVAPLAAFLRSLDEDYE
jgi:cytochrome c peroxidase